MSTPLRPYVRRKPATPEVVERAKAVNAALARRAAQEAEVESPLATEGFPDRPIPEQYRGRWDEVQARLKALADGMKMPEGEDDG